LSSHTRRTFVGGVRKIFGPKTEKITGRWINCIGVLFNRVLLSNRGWDGEACGT